MRIDPKRLTAYTLRKGSKQDSRAARVLHIHNGIGFKDEAGARRYLVRVQPALPVPEVDGVCARGGVRAQARVRAVGADCAARNAIMRRRGKEVAEKLDAESRTITRLNDRAPGCGARGPGACANDTFLVSLARAKLVLIYLYQAHK
ncbi:hypothetical protein EVAR_43262_1 [Eumeta japonica]|uniref:Uncharacterized protein n=1 Tax=Eumeta variegata TaxID=151549 RepID=A0A4C1WVU5_EUMVA|nr:hypothetical protein EVAR_43262_1 [Eumeta japonica]